MKLQRALALIIVPMILIAGLTSNYTMTAQTDSDYQRTYERNRAMWTIVDGVSLLAMLCFARKAKGKRRVAFLSAAAGVLALIVLTARAGLDPFGNFSILRAWQAKFGYFMDGVVVAAAASILMR